MPASVAHRAQNAPQRAQIAEAWSLTRRLCPRPAVRVMVREADGGLFENAYPRFFPVGPQEPSTPWAMPLADESGSFRLLCFDFDGKEKDGQEAVERAVDDCSALVDVLRICEIDHVVCASSASGGRHVWVALPFGVPAETVGAMAIAARANFRSLDHGMLLNPRQGAARPPLSPHRDGSSSTVIQGNLEQLLTSTVSAGDIDRLSDELHRRKPALRVEHSQPSGEVDASHQVHKTLSAWGENHMGTIDGGSNPSWTGFMCLLAAASAGWAYVDVQQAARVAPGMEHYRTKNTGRGDRRPRSAHEAAERLERQWEKAQQYASLHAVLPPASASPRDPADLTELSALVAAVNDLLDRFQVSPGRWGRTERAISERSIMTALAYLTLHTGKRSVAASIRDLALLTGLGRTTAADALKGLRAAGYVQLDVAADAGNASQWSLRSDFSTASGRVRSQPLNNPRPPADLFNDRVGLVQVVESDLVDARHDLFSRKGLGHLAGKAYALLRRTPRVSVGSAARALGVTERHMATVLSRLKVHRLIVKEVDGWSRSKRDLRNAAARNLGIDGTLTDRAARYAVEREVWAWWQAEVGHRSSEPRQRPRRPHVSSRLLFEESDVFGERVWPLYPRDAQGRADHREAYHWGRTGMLRPGSLWWSSRAA